MEEEEWLLKQYTIFFSSCLIKIHGACKYIYFNKNREWLKKHMKSCNIKWKCSNTTTCSTIARHCSSCRMYFFNCGQTLTMKSVGVSIACLIIHMLAIHATRARTYIFGWMTNTLKRTEPQATTTIFIQMYGDLLSETTIQVYVITNTNAEWAMM